MNELNEQIQILQCRLECFSRDLNVLWIGTQPRVRVGSLLFTVTRAQLIEAWLALTGVKYLDNVLVLIVLNQCSNQWLKLTRL